MVAADQSPSGTAMPRNNRGRVYCGYSIRPGSLWLSSVTLSGRPGRPHIANHGMISTMAGTSPPLQTKIADRNLPRLQAQANPFVKSLIAPA